MANVFGSSANSRIESFPDTWMQRISSVCQIELMQKTQFCGRTMFLSASINRNQPCLLWLVLFSRPKNETVVIVSEKEYNEMAKANAMAEFMDWIKKDKKTANKIYSLIEDIRRNEAMQGIGKCLTVYGLEDALFRLDTVLFAADMDIVHASQHRHKVPCG